MTADWAGTSRNPMFWNARIYFLSDRDGVMNVYSMDPKGRDVKQESRQHGFDVASASLSEGRVVYACGAVKAEVLNEKVPPSRPNTETELEPPAKTSPSAIVGTANLAPLAS